MTCFTFSYLSVTVFIIISTTSITMCDSLRPSHQPSISRCVNRFGLQLLQELDNGQSNVFQSPLSIAAALTMLMTGADGDTYNEINSMLGYTKNLVTINGEWATVLETVVKNNGNNLVAVGNKLLAKPGVKIEDQFRSYLKAFDADIDLNKDDIVDRINQWVKEKTRGMIPQMIDGKMQVDLAILNAVYFQGFWEKPFDPNRTKQNGIFYNTGTSSTQVAMMNQKVKTRYGHVDELGGFKMLELAYERGDFSTGSKFKMLIFLPDSYAGLPLLVNSLTIDKLDEYKTYMYRADVIVNLPKFSLKTKYDLSDKLQKMGIHQAFSSLSADFSGITGQRDLFVSAVLHKAAIEVDEKGTRASAATAVIMTRMAVIERTEEFIANHPFLYFIVDDRTGVMLFAGTVNAL